MASTDEIKSALLAKIEKRLEEDDSSRVGEVRVFADSFLALTEAEVRDRGH